MRPRAATRAAPTKRCAVRRGAPCGRPPSHQTKKGSGTPTDAMSHEPHQRVRRAPRRSRLAPTLRCGRARLSAFHHGTCGGEPTPPLSSRTHFPGPGRSARPRWFERSRAFSRALPAPSCPSPATWSQTGHRAGRAFSRSRPGAEATSPRPREPLSIHQPVSPAAVLSASEIRYM